ncbi:MAG: isochorismatase family protein [Acidobacteria bacterium]|nr:isochorismatase family protein [Acidobacteriota bacterium]
MLRFEIALLAGLALPLAGQPAPLDPARTALVLCDVWDDHWCRGAAQRVGVLAPKIDAFAAAARQRGVLVIHAPSDTMDFYKDAPQRRAMLAIPQVAPPAPVEITSPPLPIDDSDGGCDTPGDKSHRAWSRQHPAVRIAEGDLISDQGAEVYSALQARGVKLLLVAGVHTNMCILNRTFAIKQMTKWGVRCVLVRDLTDAMYDPQDRPFVSHDRGTELVIEHIAKYWCPVERSADLLRVLSK